MPNHLDKPVNKALEDYDLLEVDSMPIQLTQDAYSVH